MEFRVRIIGNKYRVERKRFWFFWRMVACTRNGMFAQHYCDELNKTGQPPQERRGKKYFLELPI